MPKFWPILFLLYSLKHLKLWKGLVLHILMQINSPLPLADITFTEKKRDQEQ